MNPLESLERALNTALHHAGLPQNPKGVMSVAPQRYDDLIRGVGMLLFQEGFTVSPVRIARFIQTRGYTPEIVPERARPLPPITVRSWIDDALTDVLGKYRLPATQRAGVVLPVYHVVIQNTIARVERMRRLSVPTLMVADALKTRGYLPPAPQARNLQAKAPGVWRQTVPADKGDTRFAVRQGIRTHPIIRVFANVARGVR